MFDLKKLFPNTKFSTVEELKAKENEFSVGDRVKVADNIRCIQNGQIGTIVHIEPEDKHGWKSFIVKFDDEKYGAMGFQSGNIDKINERKTTMKRINENQKVTLTLGQLKRLVKESEGEGTDLTQMKINAQWEALDSKSKDAFCERLMRELAKVVARGRIKESTVGYLIGEAAGWSHMESLRKTFMTGFEHQLELAQSDIDDEDSLYD